MNLTTLTLIPATTYGVPSGNYNGTSPAFIGNACPAANYYPGQGSTQTVVFNVSDFYGKFTLQATLESDRDQAAWFDVETVDLTAPPTPHTVVQTVTDIGNFVWLRVAVTEFTRGVINPVTVSY